MAYTPTVWATGDVVTAEKLNKLENTIVGNVKDVSGEYEYVPDGASEPVIETFDNAVIENDLEGNVANAPYAHAEGSGTTAGGNVSHAEGGGTIASGDGSHAEGHQTTASGMVSHAEGGTTTASGVASHAEGGDTIASGNGSHAEGAGTIASGQFQHVSGKYNVADTLNTYCEIIGIGNDEISRKNGRTLDWNGNEKLTGSLTLGAGTANEVTLTPETLKILLDNITPPEETQV